MEHSHSKVSGSDPLISIKGAGIIGLSIALALAKRGGRVAIHDIDKAGRGASWAAAGMLAPAFEASGEADAHPRLFDLCLLSSELWQDWSAELEAASGLPVGYSNSGAMAVAVSEDGAQHLDELSVSLAERGLSFERLSPDRARQIEPSLSEKLIYALKLPSDRQVDNRRVVAALVKRITDMGLFVDEPPVHADITINAQGWQTAGVQPVGGQMFSLQAQAGHPAHVIRAGSTYIVPKSDRTIIGATVEAGRVVRQACDGKLDELASQAAMICPALATGERLESWAGTRPATADKAPIIGWTSPGQYVASGHFRNGILLAPLTAEIVAGHILEGTRSTLAAAFDPSRFAADK